MELGSISESFLLYLALFLGSGDFMLNPSGCPATKCGQNATTTHNSKPYNVLAFIIALWRIKMSLLELCALLFEDRVKLSTAIHH